MTSTRKDHKSAGFRHGESRAVSVRGFDDGGGVAAAAVGTLRDLGGFPPDVEVDYSLDLDACTARAYLLEGKHGAMLQEARQIGTVAAARAAGLSWQQIADALEIPRRTCVDRYSPHIGLL